MRGKYKKKIYKNCIQSDSEERGKQKKIYIYNSFIQKTREEREEKTHVCYEFLMKQMVVFVFFFLERD